MKNFLSVFFFFFCLILPFVPEMKSKLVYTSDTVCKECILQGKQRADTRLLNKHTVLSEVHVSYLTAFIYFYFAEA